MLDFDAYLKRIGLGSGDLPTWQAVHRAHATSIPFENLDSHRGIPVSLDPPDLERKMVAEQRGGYCFEHNLLLASAIEHLGLRVELMLARVRISGAPPEARPLGPLVLRVTDGDGKEWHADVGFGLDSNTVFEQSGWSFRVVEDGPELVLQTRGPDGWSDVYGFVPHPVPRIDIEVSNWWICTNPRSPFVFGLIASVNHDDGRREAISDWSGPLRVMTMTPDGVDSSEQPRAVIPDKLKQFGLPGFQLSEDGRVRAA
jgi:N-hydroxyarylamine O-acetyltransferase